MNHPGQIIWNQIEIGVKMACGARKPLLNEHGIQFNVGRGKLRKLVIALTPADTYTVTYYRFRGDWTIAETEEATDVYADNLNSVVLRLGDR